MHKNSTPNNVLWTVADLIDFEVLMAEDGTLSEEKHDQLKRRDRGVFRSLKGQGMTAGDDDRGWWFRRWLDERRKERFSGDSTPGEEIASLFATIKFVLLILGLLTARAMVWSFFHDAKIDAVRPEPINVVAYGIVCIGVTFVLSICGFWVLLSNGARSWLPKPPAFARGMLLRALTPLLKSITNRTSDRLSAERGLRVKEISGALKQRIIMQRDGISAALLCCVQVFGLSFACGVLLFSGFDLSVASRIFGWQTTLFSKDASFVHEYLRVISAPWSWRAPEGIGFPSLEHVRETQFFPAHGLSGFPPEAAKVWGVFVVLSAFVYGVLPRVALYLFSRKQLNRALNEQDFDDFRSDLLMDRLMTPDLTIEKEAELPSAVLPPLVLPHDVALNESLCTVILRSDLDAPGVNESIVDYLKQKRFQVVKTIVLPDSPKAISKVIEDIPKSRAYLVHESWMWQEGEVTDLLREIRQSVGPKKSVLLSLVGKPNASPLGHAPLTSDVDVWNRLVKKIGDPYIGVISFLTPK